jgi:hypothetical protein
MARDAQADGRADHPDLISIQRIAIEPDSVTVAITSVS